jgi:hypothetical protein
MNDKRQSIPPDYTDYPREDDDPLEEMIDEDDIKIEKLLDEQEELNSRLDSEFEERRHWVPMSNSTPFDNGNSPFGSSRSGGAPWEKKDTTPSWGNSGGWSAGSGWSGSGSFGQPKKEEPKVTPTGGLGNRKKVVICDVLDCLYESWESNGRPNIMPRALFDLKPKFDVWDKIASFNPTRLYVIFPANDIVPAFGNPGVANLTLEYIKVCISTYLRIRKDSVFILKQQVEGSPKERIVYGAVRDWRNKEDMVYIGINSGRWGLSSKDADAAHACGIDYIDMYNLLAGKYEYE